MVDPLDVGPGMADGGVEQQGGRVGRRQDAMDGNQVGQFGHHRPTLVAEHRGHLLAGDDRGQGDPQIVAVFGGAWATIGICLIRHR